ncbi:MAG: DPP IV N-terminal domain-containing protein [Planctomycetes bacterium]|nr:DPP IV N-terminal domain-containing protein [Planctomycetota bacterium]
MRLIGLSFLTLLVGLVGCAARGSRVIDAAARHRVIAEPEFIEQYAATRRFSLGRPRSIRPAPDGSAVLFLRSGPRSFVQDLYEFDTTTGRERLLLTADQILQGAEEQLSVEELARRERARMTARGIARYRLSKDGSRILVSLSGRLFVIDRASDGITELSSDKGFPIDARFSPDAKYVSCVRNGELYVTNFATGKEEQLTSGAGGNITNGLSEFIAQEEMGRHSGYWWSPDSSRLVYQQTDTTGLETMHIADARFPDREPHTWPYPRPGKTNAKVRLGIISVTGGDTTWVKWTGERYPYLATVKWKENSPLTILVQNREQTAEALLTVYPNSGATSLLFVESDTAWLNLDQSMPYWLPDGKAFLWTTERYGAWQLELRDRFGTVLKRLTTLDFGLKGFVSFDKQSRSVYVRATENPIETHLYRIALDNASAAPVQLTHEPGLHGFTFSKNHEVFVHSYNTITGDSRQVVRRADGTEIGVLKSVAEQRPFTPNVEFTVVGDGPTFHAAIIRPRNFRPEGKYPVIVSVYGGPHGQVVQASPNRYLLQQWMADHGFIVVTLDGRGTPSRGRAWERVIKGDLISIPLEDQVSGLQALGRDYPELDLHRVGIYGWSFGGYFSAMAVMQRPDVYHVGVAGAPVADWMDYDTHYTERYMGLPQQNADGYETSSVLTYAKDLVRPLLIIHGTTDDNVYFTHALKMSNALFRAGKEHDFLPLSGFTHMVADPKVTRRLQERIIGYFEKHLLGV